MCVSKEFCEEVRRDIPALKSKVDELCESSAIQKTLLDNISTRAEKIETRLNQFENNARNSFWRIMGYIIPPIITAIIGYFMGG